MDQKIHDKDSFFHTLYRQLDDWMAGGIYISVKWVALSDSLIFLLHRERDRWLTQKDIDKGMPPPPAAKF